jgi:2'-5' RNA ligase
VASVSLSIALARVLADREKTAQIHVNPKAFFVHVRVPEHVSSQLAEVQRRVIPDADKHQEIDHVTLVYTKKALEDHPPEKVHAALAALRRIGERTEPIEAKIQGWGYFDGAQKDGKPTTALVALLDAPGLEHLHVDMVRALKDHGVEPSDTHIFTPHITLGYLGAGERTDKPLETLAGRFTIDKAHVASRDMHEIPLTGHENVGLKAAMHAAFSMSPSELRKQLLSVPGKGETSPVVGPATLQTGGMHSGGGFK